MSRGKLQRRARPRVAHAHPLVAETACEMANAVFEEAMTKSNVLYAQLRASNPEKSTEELRHVFVRWLAPHMLERARATLGEMLGRPGTEALKSEIYEALIKDAVLSRGRRGKTPLIVAH